MLDLVSLHRVVPKGVQKRIDQGFVDKVNGAIGDPEFADTLCENILGYADVLADGRYKVDDYINAVKYVSYKVMGKSNIAAYVATFPDRYTRYKSNGVSDKDVASYVTSYNKNKLVNKVYEQTLIPAHILNNHAFQKAVNKQLSIMDDPDASYKVQSDAANSLMVHLKPPAAAKLEVEIGVVESTALAELREVSSRFAALQLRSLEAGTMTALEVAHQGITIEGEVVDG